VPQQVVVRTFEWPSRRLLEPSVDPAGRGSSEAGDGRSCMIAAFAARWPRSPRRNGSRRAAWAGSFGWPYWRRTSWSPFLRLGRS